MANPWFAMADPWFAMANPWFEMANPWFDRTLLPNYLWTLNTNRQCLWNRWISSHWDWNSNLRDASNPTISRTISHLQNSQNYRTINSRFQLFSSHQNFNTQDHHFRYQHNIVPTIYLNSGCLNIFRINIIECFNSFRDTNIKRFNLFRSKDSVLTKFCQTRIGNFLDFLYLPNIQTRIIWTDFLKRILIKFLHNSFPLTNKRTRKNTR